ncbi:MAG: hypothetical protein ABR888_07430 [Thermoplasmata archaeon]
MRSTKAMTVGLIAVAVLATAGTGFAAFTSSAFVNGSASAGTLGPMAWGSEPASAGLSSYSSCLATVSTTSSPSDTLDLVAGNLAPGDLCSFGDSLHNAGSLPALASETITSTSGDLCAVTVFSDSFFTPSTLVGAGGETGALAHTVPAGSSIQWAGFIQLSPTAGNAYSDTSCGFSITLTGSVGS